METTDISGKVWYYYDYFNLCLKSENIWYSTLLNRICLKIEPNSTFEYSSLHVKKYQLLILYVQCHLHSIIRFSLRTSRQNFKCLTQLKNQFIHSFAHTYTLILQLTQPIIRTKQENWSLMYAICFYWYIVCLLACKTSVSFSFFCIYLWYFINIQT